MTSREPSTPGILQMRLSWSSSGKFLLFCSSETEILCLLKSLMPEETRRCRDLPWWWRGGNLPLRTTGGFVMSMYGCRISPEPEFFCSVVLKGSTRSLIWIIGSSSLKDSHNNILKPSRLRQNMLHGSWLNMRTHTRIQFPCKMSVPGSSTCNENNIVEVSFQMEQICFPFVYYFYRMKLYIYKKKKKSVVI